MKCVHTAFLLPVIGGELYLGQRGTPPFAGYWGGIGGKASKDKPNPWNEPKLIEKMGGARVVSRVDEFMNAEGLEYIASTAVREFCEEAFSDKKFPEDFSHDDITDVLRVCSVEDVYNGAKTSNYFYVAKINRKDFCLNPRELTKLKPLREIERGDKIFPMTRITMANIHYLIEFEIPLLPRYESLREQIEPFLQEDFITREDARFTDSGGAYIYYGEAYFGRPETDRFVVEVLERARRK